MEVTSVLEAKLNLGLEFGKLRRYNLFSREFNSSEKKIDRLITQLPLEDQETYAAKFEQICQTIDPYIAYAEEQGIVLAIKDRALKIPVEDYEPSDHQIIEANLFARRGI